MAGSLKTFEIIFSETNGTYYEGDEVRGELVLDIEDEMVIDNVILELTGLAMVEQTRESRRWRGGGPVIPPHAQGDSRGRIEEQHLNQTVQLYTGGRDCDILVAAGRYEFPFRVQLPFNLPSTFVGDHGNIKYIARAAMERPFWGQATTTKEFTVFSIVDLSLIPHVTEPIQWHKVRQESALCCMSGHIAVSWRLSRKGFVPGENIKINGEVKNNSTTRIKKTRACLIQHIRYFGGFHERKQVAMIEKGGLPPGNIHFWREEMEIPPLPPTGLKGSNLMQLWYTLKLRVIPRGLSEPMEAATKIIIATVAEADEDGVLASGSSRQRSISPIPDSYTYDRLTSLPPGEDDFTSDLSYFI